MCMNLRLKTLPVLLRTRGDVVVEGELCGVGFHSARVESVSLVYVISLPRKT